MLSVFGSIFCYLFDNVSSNVAHDFIKIIWIHAIIDGKPKTYIVDALRKWAYSLRNKYMWARLNSRKENCAFTHK